MKNLRVWPGLLTVACLGLFANPVHGLSILVAPGTNPDIDIVPRLIELGHTVQEMDPANWDATFDYSTYDVVAFQFSSGDPADIPNLVAAVDAEEVGVVCFRATSSIGIATALGLIVAGTFDYQNGHQFSVIDNAHAITHNLEITTYDLGYTNMSYVTDPGLNTTTLGNGPDGAALVVHDSRRAVMVPFYGHFAGYDTETEIGKGITDRSLLWAANQLVPSHQTTWSTVKSYFSD